MVTRIIFQLGIQICLIQTFYFGSRSGVNNGIISVIFSTGVLFTALIFYCLYGQKLTLWDFAGCVFIIVCVALIAVGGTGEGHGGGKSVAANLTQDEKTVNLVLAVIMAIVTGLVFALNSLSLKFCSDIGCGEAQANLDAMFWMFVILFPGFLVFA